MTLFIVSLNVTFEWYSNYLGIFIMLKYGLASCQIGFELFEFDQFG